MASAPACMKRYQIRLRQMLLLEKLPGETMFDRTMLTLAFATIFATLHVCLLLDIFVRPRLSTVALLLDIPTLVILWMRAASAIVTGWGDPSARVLRFSSIGALLLTFWPVAVLLTVALTPPELD